MSIQQAETMLLNSTAGPLPTGATGTRFPLTVGSAPAISREEGGAIIGMRIETSGNWYSQHKSPR
jgi:hypothetical protein